MKKKAICTDPTWAGRSDCAHCAIRNRVLFADLPHDELNVALLAVDDLVYQPDRLLYRIGEQGKVLYTVRRGMVKLVRDLADGTERVVRLLKAGDVAGLEMAIGSHYKHTAITLTETEVCRIPLSTLERLEVHSPRLAHQLICLLYTSPSPRD